MSDETTYLIGVEVRKSVVTDVIVKVSAASKEEAAAKTQAAGTSFIEDPHTEDILLGIDNCHWVDENFDATGRVFPESYTSPPYSDEDVLLNLTEEGD